MQLEGLYLVTVTDCKPLYNFINGTIFKGCTKESPHKYKLSEDTDFLGSYFLEELVSGRHSRYRDEDLRYHLGVEVK